jgi:hypothetical protein
MRRAATRTSHSYVRIDVMKSSERSRSSTFLSPMQHAHGPSAASTLALSSLAMSEGVVA